VHSNRFQVFKKRWFQALLAFFILIYSLSCNIILLVNTDYEVFKSGNETIAKCSTPINASTIQSWIYLSNFLAVLIIAQTTVKDRKFAISVIGLGVTALICKPPLGLYILIKNNMNIRPEMSMLLINIAVALLTIENSASFFVNMILNSVFYQEFIIMIGLTKNQEITVTHPKKIVSKNIKSERIGIKIG